MPTAGDIMAELTASVNAPLPPSAIHHPPPPPLSPAGEASVQHAGAAPAAAAVAVPGTSPLNASARGMEPDLPQLASRSSRSCSADEQQGLGEEEEEEQLEERQIAEQNPTLVLQCRGGGGSVLKLQVRTSMRFGKMLDAYRDCLTRDRPRPGCVSSWRRQPFVP